MLLGGGGGAELCSFHRSTFIAMFNIFLVINSVGSLVLLNLKKTKYSIEVSVYYWFLASGDGPWQYTQELSNHSLELVIVISP